MSALQDQSPTPPPPIISPIRLNESEIDPIESHLGRTHSRPASLASCSNSARQSVIYNNETGMREDFYTIPLHETTIVEPPYDERGETILIAFLLFLASIAFSGALVVCVLVSLADGPAMDAPVPVLLFAMSAFLVVAGLLVAKGVSLWLKKRDRRNARKISEVKEEKIDAYTKGFSGNTPPNGLNEGIPKQNDGGQV